MEQAVRKQAAGWGAWAVCVLVAALTLAVVIVDFLPGQSQPLSLRIADWSFTAVAIPLAAVGALITVHRPGNRLGGLLLVGALSIGVVKVAQELVQYGVGHPGTVPALAWIGWVSNWVWVPAILMFLLLPVLFPDGQPPSPRWWPSSGRRCCPGSWMRHPCQTRSGCPARPAPCSTKPCRRRSSLAYRWPQLLPSWP
jgi:hypothetical protein